MPARRVFKAAIPLPTVSFMAPAFLNPNLLGTGQYGAMNFSASEYQKAYSLNYVDPYFTTYGVSQAITIFSTITTPSTNLNQASYTMDGYGGTVMYGLPVSLSNRVNLGFGYTYIVLHDVNGGEPPNR